MRTKFCGMLLIGASAVMLAESGACNLQSAFTVDVPFELAGAGLAEFLVEAGVPVQKTGQFSFDSPVTIGSGSLRILPQDITVTPADDTGNKSSLLVRLQSTCNAQVEGDNILLTCLDQGSTQEECHEIVRQAVANCLNGLMEIQATVWIGTTADIGEACENGEEYEVFAQFDESFNVTSVSVSPSSLSQATRDLLNSGSFGVCIEVTSPVDGTIIIDQLTFTLGL